MCIHRDNTLLTDIIVGNLEQVLINFYFPAFLIYEKILYIFYVVFVLLILLVELIAWLNCFKMIANLLQKKKK